MENETQEQTKNQVLTPSLETKSEVGIAAQNAETEMTEVEGSIAEGETTVVDPDAQLTEVKTAEEVTAKPTKMKQFLQFLIFTGFSISAGVIQFVSTGLLSTWTGWIPYWIAYLIGLVLSVVWNFTFNRKFTFKAANNVPLAMGLVVIYYCAFTPLSTFGADAIVDAWKTAAGNSWNDAYEMVITAAMMILNFLTEFLWDKFVVFNGKVTDRILTLFKKSGKQAESGVTEEQAEIPAEEAVQSAENDETTAPDENPTKDDTN